jgi:iron complex outermembrane receptor protein
MALGFAMPAMAQQTAQTAPQTVPPPAENADQERDRDVVVVTANKREESVQDIAVAVTAITSEARDDLGLQTLQDMTNFTPGLQYNQANERVILRGVGRNTNNFGSEPGVANYTDGVYQSFASIASRQSIFIDRTEIVRGPQGTLYGRNSIGGALNIISKRPTDDFYAETRLDYGDYNTYGVAIATSGQLLGEALRGRVAANFNTQDDGFLHNASGLEDEGGKVENWYAEFQLDGQIGELDWWVKYGFGEYHNEGPPGGRSNVGLQAPYDLGFAPTGSIYPNPAYAYSGVPTAFTQIGTTTSNPGQTDLRTFNTDRTQRANLNGYEDIAINATYHAPGFDIKYVGGYIWYLYQLETDADGTPVTSFTLPAISAFPTLPDGTRFFQPSQKGYYEENRAFFSNEINFISTNDGPFQWIAGLYQYQENFSQQPTTAFLPDQKFTTNVWSSATLTPVAPTQDSRIVFSENSGVNNSLGAFAQIDWEFTDTLKTTVGLRYSHDDKEMTEDDRLLCFYICLLGTAFQSATPLFPLLDITATSWSGRSFNNAGVEVAPPGVISSTPTNLSGFVTNPLTGIRTRELADTWNATTGTAGLEWRPTSDDLLFVKYSRGYKAGGFNAVSASPFPRTDQERIDSYEFGWKRDWRALNLQTNIDMFYYNYQDVQTPIGVVPDIGPAYTGFINIPGVHTKGFEIESTWQPIDDLNITFNYAYIDAEISGGCCYIDSVDPYGLQPGVVGTPSLNPTSINQVQQNVSGNQLPNSAKNKVAINVLYNFDLGDNGTLTPSLSYYWRDQFSSSIFNREYNLTPAYDQTDFRLIWRDADDHSTWIFFVRNVLDQDGFDGRAGGLRRFATTTGTPTPGVTFNPALPANATTNYPGIIYTGTTLTYPRTWGLQFQYKF